MSGTHKVGKKVAYSNRKSVRSGTTIPPTPAIPCGQTCRYGIRAVAHEGKNWYKKHTEAKYFPNVVIEDMNLDREFRQIMHRIHGLHMGFIFDDPQTTT